MPRNSRGAEAATGSGYAGMTEHQIQSALFRAYGVRGIQPSVMFAIPNGGARDAATGQLMKREGVTAGIPDICVIFEGAIYFIEIKKANGKLSAAQKEVHHKLTECGATVLTCYGFLAAIDVLESIGIIMRVK